MLTNKKITSYALLIILLFSNLLIFPSVLRNTLIKTPSNLVSIQELQAGNLVTSQCNINKTNSAAVKKIKSISSNSIYKIKTPTCEFCVSEYQLIFDVNSNDWVHAKDITLKSIFLTAQNTTIPCISAELIHGHFELYDLMLESPHTFYATKDELLMHNFFPIPIMIGLSIAFGDGIIITGCGAGLGILGGLGIWKSIKNNQTKYGIHNDTIFNNASDAQAPGIPTKEDGFIPPKKWDGKKVKNPNGPGYGYPDKDGNIWVPSGPNGHGGPHWDVQRPKGGYDNILPGGKIRGHK